jgi:hypothetical protein
MVHIPAVVTTIAKYAWDAFKYVGKKVEERKQTGLVEGLRQTSNVSAGNMLLFRAGSKEHRRSEKLADSGRLVRTPFGGFMLAESVNPNAFRGAFGRR